MVKTTKGKKSMDRFAVEVSLASFADVDRNR